jgi:hypothetical protein
MLSYIATSPIFSWETRVSVGRTYPRKGWLQKSLVIHFQDFAQQARIFLADRPFPVFHHGKVTLRYPGQLGKPGLRHALLGPRSQQGNSGKVFLPVFREGLPPGNRIDNLKAACFHDALYPVACFLTKAVGLFAGLGLGTSLISN